MDFSEGSVRVCCDRQFDFSFYRIPFANNALCGPASAEVQHSSNFCQHNEGVQIIKINFCCYCYPVSILQNKAFLNFSCFLAIIRVPMRKKKPVWMCCPLSAQRLVISGPLSAKWVLSNRTLYGPMIKLLRTVCF